ncbi:YMGG-like glycine zipper-containing protein [Paraburkholderia sediminicola]|uniref:YMGG-like glycine zipper-containing protein n=1 Tax=Paraburkholderia sediminicola TaxID=458836 RepID=UPI0038BDFB6A
MLRNMRRLTGVLALALACSVSAQQPIVYPAKGQSASQQQNDTGQCRQWATQTTGIDPVALAQQGANQPGAPQPQGQRLKGAAGGAALGAAVGAVAGDAGKGAAIGAITGTAAGGMRARRSQQNAAEQTQANQQQTQQALATYNRAVAACMTGRGYTVQ